jgi:hypothetical protein
VSSSIAVGRAVSYVTIDDDMSCIFAFAQASVDEDCADGDISAYMYC